MSQYNKTVLTHAGLELAKRANAGQAKFGITRAVTSADDWSNKTVQDLEEVTTIPNIMQQGTIMDTDEVESNNSVIGVSLCFTNKKLSTGYQIRIIGLYVKEEGQENDFLYAVTTAVTPENMPDFNDKVLYRFNLQMYLVIGKAQAVNVVINEGTAVTHGQLDKYKAEVTGNLKKLENTHKEDMSHVAKSASINGGAEILPDSTGKLNLVVPDPDLSKYVSLEQLGELLQAKANVADVPDKTDTEEGIRQAKELAQEADAKAQNALDNKADKTAVDAELAKKDDITDVDAKINSNVTKLNQAINTKANASDVYTKPQIDTAFGQRDTKIGNNTNVINTVNEALKSLIPDDTHAPALPAGFDLNNYFIGWRRSVNTTLKNMPFGWLSDTMYFQGTVAGSDGRFEIALYIGNGPNANPKIAYRFYGWDHWKPWVLFADNDDISNLQNQIQQLRESQFEVQTFTDATAAANWEAQRPGKRMAIVNQ